MKRAFLFLSSMQLGVWLLAFALALVFFGTLDQVNLGIHEAQRLYFQSWLALWSYPPQWPGGDVLRWLTIPLPGGHLLGSLLLLNLGLAQIRVFKLTKRHAANIMTHSGLMLLLLSQLFTDLFQEEHFMWLAEGESSSHLESFYDDELAVTDITDPETHLVTAIPMSALKEGEKVEGLPLPFDIVAVDVMKNALVARYGEQREGIVFGDSGLSVTHGLGAFETRPAHRENERNVATALVRVEANGESLGAWLVSNVFDETLPAQTFQFGGRRYRLEMRYARESLPFSLKLMDFTHERYEGTDIPKSFSSLVRIQNKSAGEDREALIYMNHPLRYGGWVFYQASFAEQDTKSMFQVVRNPSWTLPYVACSLISIGIAAQLLIGIGSARRRREAS